MKSRNPLTDPQPGDVITDLGWTITVSSRTPGNVEYTAVKKSRPNKVGSQPLSVWQGWAKTAKVKEVSSSDGECVATANVSGPCEVDQKPIRGHAHCVGVKVFCSDHCPAFHKKGAKVA